MASVLRADLIVCTRHRPHELQRVLESIRAQHTIPSVVLVVDSSDDDASQLIVEQNTANWPAGSRLAYLHSTPALPHQRNVGIDATTHDIVCFLDDDVVLEPDYFLAVGAAFAADERGDLGGVGATILNQPTRPRLWKLDAALGLDSAREGAVLKTGRNIRVFTPKPRPLEVEWLAGLAMSFRRDVFAKHRPNELLTVEGEDVELTYRVVQDWRLQVLPEARVRHDESPRNRPDRAEVAARELGVRHLRCHARTGRLRMRWFWLGVALQLLRAAITSPLSAEQRGIFRGTLRGVRRILSSPAAG
jgi:GT2 family glycosyltransferase